MNPADTIATLSGVAQARGHTFAERIAGARLGQRWAHTREESLRVAKEVLADITQDERELDGSRGVRVQRRGAEVARIETRQQGVAVERMERMKLEAAKDIVEELSAAIRESRDTRLMRAASNYLGLVEAATNQRHERIATLETALRHACEAWFMLLNKRFTEAEIRERFPQLAELRKLVNE